MLSITNAYVVVPADVGVGQRTDAAAAVVAAVVAAAVVAAAVVAAAVVAAVG